MGANHGSAEERKRGDAEVATSVFRETLGEDAGKLIARATLVLDGKEYGHEEVCPTDDPKVVALCTRIAIGYLRRSVGLMSP